LKSNRACVIIAADVARKTQNPTIYRTSHKLAQIAEGIGFKIVSIFDDDEIRVSRCTSQLFNTRRYETMEDSVPHDTVLILSKERCPIYEGGHLAYDGYDKTRWATQLPLG